MSIALLEECANETRRLAVAGSALAVGDFRLKRLMEPLGRVGAKSAVFGRVAKAVETLVDGGERDSAKNLLGLTMLVNSILYTQGKTDIEGEVAELESSDMGFLTGPTTLRILKPLMAALTRPGSGRFDVISKSHERGVFKDIRLVRPAMRALDDSYGEIADYMAEKVLPVYGRAILPQVRETLDLKGKRGHARRLTLLYKILGEEAWDVIVEALEKGSKDIKLAAIQCLESPGKKSEEALTLLLEQTGARNKEVRGAAVLALSKQKENDRIRDLLITTLDGKDFEAAVASIRKKCGPKLLKRVVGMAGNLFSGLLGESKPDDSLIINRFMGLLSCLEDRSDARVEAFLISCFARMDELLKIKAAGASYYSGKDIVESIAELLLAIETRPALQALVDRRETMSAALLPYAFMAALKIGDPALVYDNFSHWVRDKSKPGKKMKAKKILSVMDGVFSHRDPHRARHQLFPAQFHSVEWDRRWVETGVEADVPSVVASLITPGDEEAVEYLLEKYETGSASDLAHILFGLIRARRPDVVPLLLRALGEKIPKRNHTLRESVLTLIGELPPKAISELEKCAADFPEKVSEDIQERIEKVRTDKGFFRWMGKILKR